VLEHATAPVYEVKAEPWTVEMKVQELRVLLTVSRQVRFLDLFTPQQSKLEMVVTFLALLELMRQRVAQAIQEGPFSDILIAARELDPARPAEPVAPAPAEPALAEPPQASLGSGDTGRFPLRGLTGTGFMNRVGERGSGEGTGDDDHG
jgi:hypothetical protein